MDRTIELLPAFFLIRTSPRGSFASLRMTIYT
jgi:hypothetical protein